jgi:hypothetical protein
MSDFKQNAIVNVQRVESFQKNGHVSAALVLYLSPSFFFLKRKEWMIKLRTHGA